MTNIPMDQTRDISGRETHRLTSLYPAPDFVKSASDERLKGSPELPRHLYADLGNKLYPCHTAPATWMSALHFADKQASYTEKQASDIRNRLRDSAKYFGITSLVEDCLRRLLRARRAI